MKSYKPIVFLLVLLSWAGTAAAQQYDDMYYDPDRDKGFFYGYQPNKDTYKYDKNQREDTYAYNEAKEETYEDDESYDYEDYDYYYSSRIRRFHRPVYGFDYFDPVYVDLAYYDPFLTPGITVLIYDDFYGANNWWRWRRWNRWNRWSSWNYGAWNNWNAWGPSWGWGLGWNSWDPWNPWNRWNSWSFGPTFNFFNFNNGFGGGFYCPPTWGNGYVYNTVNDIRENTYYGPRRTNSTFVPNGGRNPRLDNTGISSDRKTTTGVTLPNDRVKAAPISEEENISNREKAHSEKRNATNDIINERNTVIERPTDKKETERSSWWNDRRDTNTGNERTNRSKETTKERINTTEKPKTETQTRRRNEDSYEAPRTRSYDSSRNNSSDSFRRSGGSSDRSSSSGPRIDNSNSSRSGGGGSSSSGSSRSSGGSSSNKSSGSTRRGGN